MLISKSYKFKLLPTSEQRFLFAKYAGSCRYIFNWGLAKRKELWESKKESLSYNDLANLLTLLKKKEETIWLKETPAQQRGRNKKKFSKKWIKYQNKIRKIDRKITRIRHDFLHKVSTDIAKNHSYIVLEDLRIKNMSKSASGTIEEPGKNVSAKSGLNRSILRQGWYKFETLLNYKSNWYGGYLDFVDPKNSSRECARCHAIAIENRESQSLFCCKSCGYETNADYNASINIFTRGHWGCASGDVELIESMKLEPLTLH